MRSRVCTHICKERLVRREELSVFTIAYSAECLEGVFCELRRYGVLRNSPPDAKIAHLGDTPSDAWKLTCTRWRRELGCRDKGKLAARRGRKAYGPLPRREAAGLPDRWPTERGRVCSFRICTYRCGR